MKKSSALCLLLMCSAVLPAYLGASSKCLTAMPIRPFLAGRVFEPEVISEMSDALQRTCDAMRLRNLDDIASELVAEKIIELVERGVKGVETLTSIAVRELTGRE
jgi:hypothetical protein